jgi:anti-sigma-K factor RskA
VSHYDDDTLALLALGEADAAADGGAHLRECSACQAEVASLSHVVAVGRSSSPADVPTAPSADVWTKIQADIHADSNTDIHTDTHAGAESTAEVVALDSRRPARRRNWALAVAASFIGLAVGVGITLAATRTDAPTAVTVATAQIVPVSAPTAHGQAVIKRVANGQRTMTISVKDLPVAKNGFYEVWLMNAKPVRFLAVGSLDGKHNGVFQLPPGLDLSAYPYIDVSLQPFNGNPLHSGDSVVRGNLHA